jgi:dipeptidyl aminopeptidase/acylaminoacyl peptidase
MHPLDGICTFVLRFVPSRARPSVATSIALMGLAVLVSPPASAQSSEPLTVDDLTSLATPLTGPPIGSLTADGHWLAYTFIPGAAEADKEGGGRYTKTGISAIRRGKDIYITDTKTGTTDRITDGKGQIQELAWSPDGKHIAFYTDRDGALRLWLWTRETKQLRRISSTIARPSEFGGARLQWTPDGKYVIALMLPDAMTVEQANVRGANSAKTESATDPTITKGSTVVVRRVKAATTATAATPDASRPAPPSPARDTSHLWADMSADISLVNITTGEIRRIGLNRPAFWYAPSPDGKHVAFTYQSGRYRSASQALYDIEVASVAGGPTRKLVRFTHADYGLLTWSPDGTRLAYWTGGSMSNGDVHVVDVASGTDRIVSTGEHPKFALTGRDRYSVYWTRDGNTLLFVGLGQLWKVPAVGGTATRVTPESWDHEVAQIVPDGTTNIGWTTDNGRTVTVIARNPTTKDIGFFRIDITSGAATKLREEAKRYGSRMTLPVVAANGSYIVWLAEDAQHPEDLWGASADLVDAKQLTHFNPHIEKLTLGKSRVIEYKGPDGQLHRAALLLPANYKEGTRVPLIVRPYPGPFPLSDRANSFGLDGATSLSNMQMFATRGYAVLHPETPQRVGTPLKDLVDGVNAAVDKVIELGIADPEQLGVTGQSYGGYSTLSIITHTTRFKAAVESAGPSNLMSAYGHMSATGSDNSSWSETGQGLLGGHPWQYRDRYIDNSPIFFLDRVTTPLMIVHGDKDYAVPIEQADEVFVGLRRLGKEVEYRKYIGEEHVPLARENVIDYWNAVIRWMDTHIKKQPPKM